MSINRSSGPGVLNFWDGEVAIQEHSNVQVVFKKNTHSNEHLKGTKQGKVYLTNYRVIFRTKSSKDMLQELSMPFKQIKDFEIKQPVFGANFLYGKLIAEPNGGWQGSVLFEMSFKDGGAIELGQKLMDLATKPLQPMYMAATIHFAQSAPYQYGPGGAYPPQHFVPGAPLDNNQPHMYPPPPPPYQMPSSNQHQPPYPPSYNSGYPPTTASAPPQQPGSSLPPGYDPYQTPPAYNPDYKPHKY